MKIPIRSCKGKKFTRKATESEMSAWNRMLHAIELRESGLKYKKIGEIIGCSASVVQKLLRKGKSDLVQKYKKELKNEKT